MSKKLRVWWVPQVPMKQFHVEVGSLAEGRKLLQVLGDYDRFQWENRIKPDYANAGGVEEFDSEVGGWIEWTDDAGYDIWELSVEDCIRIDGVDVKAAS